MSAARVPLALIAASALLVTLPYFGASARADVGSLGMPAARVGLHASTGCRAATGREPRDQQAVGYRAGLGRNRQTVQSDNRTVTSSPAMPQTTTPARRLRA